MDDYTASDPSMACHGADRPCQGGAAAASGSLNAIRFHNVSRPGRSHLRSSSHPDGGLDRVPGSHGFPAMRSCRHRWCTVVGGSASCLGPGLGAPGLADRPSGCDVSCPLTVTAKRVHDAKMRPPPTRIRFRLARGYSCRVRAAGMEE